jgi:AcrR family transcriptional regulator
MPRESFHKLPLAKRRRLLKVAADELSKHGFLHASMNRILEQAGLSKGVAYHYFDNREDLLVTVLTDQFNRSVSDLTIDLETLTAESFWDTLAEALSSAADPNRWDSATIEIARAVWAIPVEYRTRGAVGEFWRKMTDFLRHILRHGQQIGAIRTDLPEDLLVDVAMALGEVGDRWWVEHWDAADRSEMEQLGRQLLDLIRRALEPWRHRHGKLDHSGSAHPRTTSDET